LGHRWRNSVWRLVSGGSFNVNPASVPVGFELINAPNDDRRSCCIYDFLEGAGSTVANRSIFGAGVGMDGTLTGASPGTWWSTDGPTGKSITIPGTEYVEIADPDLFRMDTNDHRMSCFFACSNTTDQVRLLDRSDGDGTWEASERYLTVDTNGDVYMILWGVGSFALATGLNLNDGKWRHLELRAMLIPDSSDVVYTLLINGRVTGSAKATSMSSSNKNHLLRIGHTGSSEALSVAGFRLENLGRR
jgi:hypothetical protein